jgi:hypothetical protein
LADGHIELGIENCRNSTEQFIQLLNRVERTIIDGRERDGRGH